MSAFRAIMLALCVFALEACSNSSFLSGQPVGGHSGNGESADAGGSEIKAKHPGDTGRPTDDSEGVPGYLTDPENNIASSPQSGRLESIVGTEGAVEAEGGGKTTDVTVSAYEVGVPDFHKASSDDDTITIEGKRVAETKAEKDGSFLLEFDTPPSGVVLLSARVQENDDKVDISPVDGNPSSASRIVAEEEGFSRLTPDAAAELARYSPMCALGTRGDISEERIFMLNFPGHDRYECRECNRSKSLAADHPLASVVENGHPCRLVEAGAAPMQVEQLPGFFISSQGVCSAVDRRCGIRERQPFIFENTANLDFVETRTYREAWRQAERQCNDYYKSDLFDIGTPEDASTTNCSGVKIGLDEGSETRTGCFVPAVEVSVLTASACFTKRLLEGAPKSEANGCDVFLEPATRCN